MSDKIQNARVDLGFMIGNGEEYKKYCMNHLAGDFAVDVLKKINRLQSFIRNGIEGGYIYYPEKSDDDPARDMINKIMGWND